MQGDEADRTLPFDDRQVVQAVLAVSDRGEVAGSVTGGCVEPAVYEEAREVLAGLRLRYPSTPLVVGVTAAESLELADDLHGCTVVPVDAEPARVVDAVLAETKGGVA